MGQTSATSTSQLERFSKFVSATFASVFAIVAAIDGNRYRAGVFLCVAVVLTLIWVGLSIFRERTVPSHSSPKQQELYYNKRDLAKRRGMIFIGLVSSLVVIIATLSEVQFQFVEQGLFGIFTDTPTATITPNIGPSPSSTVNLAATAPVTPTNLATSTPLSVSVSPTVLPSLTPSDISYIQGPIDIEILFETDQSLTIVIRGDTDFGGLALATHNETIVLSEQLGFTQILQHPDMLVSGTCLRFLRYTADIPLSRDCDQVFDQLVGETGIFWWNTLQADALSIAVERQGEIVALCTNSQPRCQVQYNP